jgi:hypothetical protein
MEVTTPVPEDAPNRCPVCGNELRIIPARLFGDTFCPTCGTLLWYIGDETEQRFFDPESDRLIERVAAKLGRNPEQLRGRRLHELGMDSLDVVELAMELEERIR